MEDLKRQLSAAENYLAKRDVSCVEDLNIGDLSAFMEISVPMECLEGFHWPDYPYLNKLYQVDKFTTQDKSGFSIKNNPNNSFAMRFLALIRCTSHSLTSAGLAM